MAKENFYSEEQIVNALYEMEKRQIMLCLEELNNALTEKTHYSEFFKETFMVSLEDLSKNSIKKIKNIVLDFLDDIEENEEFNSELFGINYN